MLARIYQPAPFVDRLPADQIEPWYSRYRLQMMLSVFFGYAGFYLVRSNFSIAKPSLINEMHMSKGDVGTIAAAMTIAYGLSKFVMGNVSDRSNPRTFMATGLILSGVINLFFGFLPSVGAMTVFWFANGWVQGMGWAPCARVLTHWFSDRERGTKFAIWNTAHNVGGGLVGPLATLGMFMFMDWRSVFYLPGIIAIAGGIGLLIFLRDTPQSVGLPSIEEYKNDYPDTGVADRERELSAKEILTQFVLNNRALWILALANVAVYVVRYGVVNWAPTFLNEVKHYDPAQSRWQFFLFEYAGIPGMLLSGWISDRYFKGRRAPISVIFMGIVVAAVLMYWQNPPGNIAVDSIALILIGFAIYGPVMLIGIAAVDLVPKKAAGTAAGFTGLFGYLGATLAEVGIGKIVDRHGWDAGFLFILGNCVVATVLLATLWNVHNRATPHAAPAREEGAA